MGDIRLEQGEFNVLPDIEGMHGIEPAVLSATGAPIPQGRPRACLAKAGIYSEIQCENARGNGNDQGNTI